MTADILLEFKDIFKKSNRCQQVVRFFNFFNISRKIPLFISDPSSKRKKVNEDWEIALFEVEKNNKDSELQKEIEKLNNQFQ